MADPNKTELQIASDSAFKTLKVNETTGYKTSREFTKGSLPYGVTLYARVRHTHPETGTSNWSKTIKFKVAVPANVIGVCLDNTGTKGVFNWIDIAGNKVDSFNWRAHPTFANMSIVTEDASRDPVELLKVPLFYIRTVSSGPAGTFAAGKKCWWLSDTPQPGFRPHSVFKRTTSKTGGGKYIVATHAKLGRYLGQQVTVGGKTCIGSKKNQTVAASQTKATFKTWILNRNDASAGQSGWRMFDIYDIGALRYLSLIASANSDSQSFWGDNSAGTAYPKTGSTNARMVFRGSHSSPEVSFEDAWRCYWYHCDNITVNTGVITLTSPMDGRSPLKFSSSNKQDYTQPTVSGWIRDVLACPFVLGDDTHDLAELFLPKTVVSAENQGTFSDYHYNYQLTPPDATFVMIGGDLQASAEVTQRYRGVYFAALPDHDNASGVGDFERAYHGSRLSKN